jgi:hypothetical protein
MEKLMKNGIIPRLWAPACAAALAALVTLHMTVAKAQEAPEPTVQPETAPQPETQTPSDTQPVDAAPEPPPPPPPPPPPELEDPTKKVLTVNAWARIGARLQGIEDPEKLDKLLLDGLFELHTDGAITENIGVTANLVGTFNVASDGTADPNGTVELLDVIGRFDIMDPLHIWVGRMLVPVDRANFSGPWFAAPWYYAGSFAGLDAMPMEGPHGRSDGVTVWGEFGGGLLKYYAGAFDLHDPDSKPLWSGRINLSLLSPEPGFYHSSTYYGEKDVLAIAVGAQHKKDGSVGMEPADDYSEFNADVLFEKNLGGLGTIGLEGAFYKYEGDNQDFDYSYLLLASYLTPGKIGPGKLQPLVRFQQAKPDEGDAASCFEAQLGYVIASYSARLALGYQYTENTNGFEKANALYLGAQFMK